MSSHQLAVVQQELEHRAIGGGVGLEPLARIASSVTDSMPSAASAVKSACFITSWLASFVRSASAFCNAS